MMWRELISKIFKQRPLSLKDRLKVKAVITSDASITLQKLHSQGVFVCGHSHIGMSFREEIKVRDSLKIIQKRLGIKGFLIKTFQGYKPSVDPKLTEGVDVKMTIDRGKDWFDQVVKDNKTGKILHEEHEPLSQHGHKV